MSRFPQVDSPINGIFLDVLSEPRTFNEAHHLAEVVNSLYAVGHPSIDATLRSLNINPSSKAAFMAGIKAYEALGAFVLTPDQHARYTAQETNEIMAELWNTENFGIDFIDQLDGFYNGLSTETPALAEAIAKLTYVEIGDSSKELLMHAHMGAGAMRALQIDVDSLLDLKDELSSLS